MNWEITFDSSITSTYYATMLDTRDQSINQSSDDNNDISDDDSVPDNNNISDNNGIFGPMSTHLRYIRRELNMLEIEAFSVYKFYKKISKAYRAKEYTREITKAIQRVNKAYDQKYIESILS